MIATPARKRRGSRRLPLRRTFALLALLALLEAAATPASGPPATASADFTGRLRELLATPPPLPAERLEQLVDLLLVSPARFAAEPDFRAALLPSIESALPADTPAALRERLLWGLARRPGASFDAIERIGRAWGTIARSSAALGLAALPDAARSPDDLDSPIRASLFALSSDLFEADEVLPLLGAVRAAHPDRPLVVLTDGPLRAALASAGGALRLRLLETWGRPFSPWPRDPISLLRTASGGALVLVRPNLQPGREEDAWLGRALLQGLPDDLFSAWGEPRWAVAPAPFHNGQLLRGAGAAWLSIHTLEEPILARLGVARVPVASFATASGIDAYLAAARAAQAEFAALDRRPVRFVHPLPDAGALETRSAAMAALGGGGGFDLDSYLTLLPAAGGGATALVADIDLARALLDRLPAEELTSFARFFELAAGGETVRSALVEAQSAARARALDAYLELVARQLADDGVTVLRLPLLLVPTALLADRAGVDHPDFLIGWNNVVVERDHDAVRAEGFASQLPTADEEARRLFAGAGAQLALFPPLRRSVVLGGGYRCASNHLRG